MRLFSLAAQWPSCVVRRAWGSFLSDAQSAAARDDEMLDHPTPKASRVSADRPPGLCGSTGCLRGCVTVTASAVAALNDRKARPRSLHAVSLGHVAEWNSCGGCTAIDCTDTYNACLPAPLRSPCLRSSVPPSRPYLPLLSPSCVFSPAQARRDEPRTNARESPAPLLLRTGAALV
eukprot:COSAG06_NODE_1300_length_9944_cov_248.353784_2_plen_176_part_00